MKNLLSSKNARLLSAAAVIALVASIVYTLQSIAEDAFFLLVPLTLLLGIVSTVIYLCKTRFSPLPSTACYSVAIGGYLASMLTNVVNTYVHMGHYNLVCFYLLVAMMALCCVFGIVACFSSDT